MTKALTLHYLWAAASTLKAEMLRVAEYLDGVTASVWKHGLPCGAQRALVSAIPMVVTEAPTLPYRWTATSTLKILTVLRCVMRDERLYGSIIVSYYNLRLLVQALRFTFVQKIPTHWHTRASSLYLARVLLCNSTRPYYYAISKQYETTILARDRKQLIAN
jgi:hypothetical protein